MSNIVWKMPNGSLAITHIAASHTPEEHARELVKRGDIPADYVAIAFNAILPANRDFRGAWLTKGTAIDIDMPKARQIHMDRARTERNKRLGESDTALLRAQEIGTPGEVAALKASRQKLRDIPQAMQARVDAAQTIDDLKMIWPQELV